MSSETLTKLEKYKNDLEQAINELNKTIANLKVNPIPSSKELSEIKKAEKRLANLNKKFIQANEYANKINECIDRDNGLKDALTRATSDSRKESIQRKIEENENTFKSIIESIEKNVNFELTESIITLLGQHKKLIALSLAGIAASSAVLTYAFFKGRDNTNPDASASLDPTATETLEPSDIPSVNPTAGIDPSANPTITPNESNAPVASSEPTTSNTPTGSQDSGLNQNSNIPPLTDINDEEQVSARANYIVENYYNRYAPNLGKTTDDVIEDLKQYNGGIVEEATYDRARFAIDSLDNLATIEIIASVDILNEVETTREKTNLLIDYSIFFVDGSLGQQLASKITTFRNAMILNANADVSNYRKEFVELFMNAWILRGNSGKEIDAYTLKHAGEMALIDMLFLNSSALVGDENLMVIKHPITSEDITFKEILSLANYEECPTRLEDGSTITLDKLSSDLYAMYLEAALIKRDSNALKLTQSR